MGYYIWRNGDKESRLRGIFKTLTYFIIRFLKLPQNGLALGDRACLALAKSKNLPVLTADKA